MYNCLCTVHVNFQLLLLVIQREKERKSKAKENKTKQNKKAGSEIGYFGNSHQGSTMPAMCFLEL